MKRAKAQPHRNRRQVQAPGTTVPTALMPLLLFGLLALPGQVPGSQAPAGPRPQVAPCFRHSVSRPLRDLHPLQVESTGSRVIPRRHIPRGGATGTVQEPLDSAAALAAPPRAPRGPLPIAIHSPRAPLPLAAAGASGIDHVVPGTQFEGTNNVNGVLPPDTNGDVGPNHYVQIVNLSFQIFDRQGTSLYGPAANNTLWSGFGGVCETHNDGDPIVLYDELADRWLLSQFAVNDPNDFHQCVAVSQTGDPTGQWHLYDFLVSATKMNDYPKFGVWPDGYYLSMNQFDGTTGQWAGQGVAVLDRERMLTGAAAGMVYFDLYATDPNLGGMLPSDLDGNPPPAGAPNLFLLFDDDAWLYAPDQLQIWQFHVDWGTPANSTFTHLLSLPTSAFDSNLCDYARNCIPQPDTAQGLDTLSDLLMYRLQYRNFGTHQTLVTNHAVDIDGTDHAGIRWYELRNSGAGWLIHQQGTYAGDAPDSNHRWMGSIAMDAFGNMALGYSVSGPDTYPSIRCVGRLSTDPAGTLPRGETSIIEGAGSQTHTAARWGDYSSMSVDPVEGNFWYTQEYYAATSAAAWQTRIASFGLAASNCHRQLLQGFEDGVVPPSSWKRLQTNPSWSWKAQTLPTPFTGAYFADVEYDPALVPQDEVLLSPEIRMTSGTLNFFSYGSTFYCRDDFDNCDLDLWIVKDDWDAGALDDVYVGKADDDWAGEFVWSFSSFDLTPLLPEGPVRIAFRYTGTDGAQIGIDDVQVCYEPLQQPLPWLSILLGN